MNPIQAILLGVIQGLTEFLPVSSTAHLLIGQKLLGIPSSAAIFSFLTIIQLGTLLSLIVYFRSDLWKIILAALSNLRGLKEFSGLPFDARLGWLIVIATVPALIAGVLLKDLVQQLFANPLLEASIRLLTVSVIMALAELIGKHSRKLDSMTWFDSLFIGLLQIIAVFPGSSRSGTTISAGLMRNFDRPSAARFAFLMSVPVMLAAGAYESLSLIKIPGLAQLLPSLLIGFVVAALVGWVAIRWFMGYLNKHSLHPFAVYCLVVGLICLFFTFA
jgi:undecaprenyl-diphosphatase